MPYEQLNDITMPLYNRFPPNSAAIAPTKQSAQSTAQSHKKAWHMAQRQSTFLKVVKENK
ncbi:MAG: hypothetical protein D8H98_16080 [Prevotella sp.]|nr:MAG: hypothetical protein D8H98_16080 [Prevotella sp.]